MADDNHLRQGRSPTRDYEIILCGKFLFWSTLAVTIICAVLNHFHIIQ